VYNADAILLVPREAQDNDDEYQRVRDEALDTTIRCSLRQMSMRQEATVLGQVATKVYRCRLQSAEDIQPGWRLRARVDGADWHEYVVRRAVHHHHWDLLLERA
jgi:hypothetical protein